MVSASAIIIVVYFLYPTIYIAIKGYSEWKWLFQTLPVDY